MLSAQENEFVNQDRPGNTDGGADAEILDADLASRRVAISRRRAGSGAAVVRGPRRVSRYRRKTGAQKGSPKGSAPKALDPDDGSAGGSIGLRLRLVRTKIPTPDY